MQLNCGFLENEVITLAQAHTTSDEILLKLGNNSCQFNCLNWPIEFVKFRDMKSKKYSFHHMT